MYLSHLNSLRALAILLIVASHTIGFFSWADNRFTEAALKDFGANGAVIFLFISGYLFQHLSRKYTYSNYLTKKIKYVLIPYLVVSLPAVAYAVFWKDPAAQYAALEGSSRAYQILWLYLHGGPHINYPLWFIPVIFLYYLAAPVFKLFDRYPGLYWSVLVLLPVSLLAHRPNFPNPGIIHSLVYFLSAYVLGMFASHFREKVDHFLDRFLWPLLILYVSYFLIHLFVSDHHGNYHVGYIFSFEKGYIDWLFLQKILLAFVLLGLLKRHDSLVAGKIRYIGEASFSIYFLHAYVIYLLHVATRWESFEGGLIQWVFLSAVVAAITIGITRLIQKILGQRSRFLIGS